MGWLSKILKRKAVENSIKGCGKQLNEIWNYLHGTIYKGNQGLIACACFVGFCSAYVAELEMNSK